MIEALMNSLIESVTVLILGKVITIAAKKGIKEKSKNRLYQNAGLQEEHFGASQVEETLNTSLILKGDLGENLLSAYEEFVKTRDTLTIEQYIKKAKSDKEITFVVELSRRAEDDVRIQLGRSVEYVVSSICGIAPSEFPTVAKRVSDFIQTVNTVHKGPKIHLILSIPIVLAFQIGQFVGLSHYDVELYHFEEGKYLEVPSLKRT